MNGVVAREDGLNLGDAHLGRQQRFKPLHDEGPGEGLGGQHGFEPRGAADGREICGQAELFKRLGSLGVTAGDLLVDGANAGAFLNSHAVYAPGSGGGKNEQYRDGSDGDLQAAESGSEVDPGPRGQVHADLHARSPGGGSTNEMKLFGEACNRQHRRSAEQRRKRQAVHFAPQREQVRDQEAEREQGQQLKREREQERAQEQESKQEPEQGHVSQGRRERHRE